MASRILTVVVALLHADTAETTGRKILDVWTSVRGQPAGLKSYDLV